MVPKVAVIYGFDCSFNVCKICIKNVGKNFFGFIFLGTHTSYIKSIEKAIYLDLSRYSDTGTFCLINGLEQGSHRRLEHGLALQNLMEGVGGGGGEA